MSTAVIEHEPIRLSAADRADRSATGACDCRVQAIQALGQLTELTLSLGIHDLDVWRGLTRLETRLIGEPLSPHAHTPGSVL